MSEESSEALGRVAADTLEQLVFLFTSPEDPDADPVELEKSIVRVRFSGPFGGELILSLPTQMLPEIAANMLGSEDEDEAPSVEQQQDASRELLNVICGNLLPAIGGADAVFELEAPEHLEEGGVDDAIQGREAEARVRLALDEGFAELVLILPDGTSKPG